MKSLPLFLPQDWLQLSGQDLNRMGLKDYSWRSRELWLDYFGD